MKYLLGIDFGGGASKATLIDTDGNIIAEASSEYPTLHPTHGACEQNPEDWICALSQNTREILACGIDSRDILAVAIDSATHSFLLCDGDFNPVTNCIHWTDTRSADEANYLNEVAGDEIFEKTYHRPSTIWTLPQLIWLKGASLEKFSRGKYLFFEKDFIRYKLTGVYCTDYIEAAGSMLYNSKSGEWDEALLSKAGLGIENMPPILSPMDAAGTVTESAAALTGLAQGTKVICGTTDTAMEIFASGAVSCGDVTVKLATAGRICVITDKAHPDAHLVNYPHVCQGLWYPGTATKAAASSYRWYRDSFGGEYNALNDEAQKIPLGADGLIFHPYLNGELTPYGDPKLSGSFTGLRSTHTKAHFTRAVLEGVALSLLDSKKYLEEIGISLNDEATLIGGGAKGELWSKITADALGMRLKITKSSDSSLGSAMLAGVAVGVFESPSVAVQKCVKQSRTVEPCPENTAKYNELYKKYKAIANALQPIYDEFG